MRAKIELHNGDCLELMKDISNGSIDMILCDLPYGTTDCKWDTVIPFEPMWAELKRVIKPNGAIVLFGSEPFSSALRMSNIKNYKYDWIWNKKNCTGGYYAKYRPMQQHENVIVFCEGKTVYNPQKEKIEKSDYRYSNTGRIRTVNKVGLYGKEKAGRLKETGERFPKTIIDFQNSNSTGKVHPTQKPVALMEYLIKTYTKEGETVLDFTMGSGTTGVACINTNRNFIGIELDKGYYEVAVKRIENHTKQMQMF